MVMRNLSVGKVYKCQRKVVFITLDQLDNWTLNTIVHVQFCYKFKACKNECTNFPTCTVFCRTSAKYKSS